MERGSSSNGGITGVKKENEDTADISEITQKTLEKIARRHRRRPLNGDTTVTYHDMTSNGYGWLLPGWIAEERRVPSGRIYKCFYDPEGYFYASQQKVIDALDRQSGLVVIDT